MYGIGAEIADPTGVVWTLVNLLDGMCTPAEIIARTLAEHPERAAADVESLLAQLIDAGHVEDTDVAETALTAREQARYDRSRQFYRWVDPKPRASPWDAQLALRAASVAVVGLGGAGGQAALELAASGVGALHVIDCDDVELSNLNRQVLYTEADVGRAKTEAATDRLRALNSDIRVTARRQRITGVAGFAALARDYDVLVLCADSPGEIRLWANRACFSAGKPWINSGYHGPRAAVCTYIPGRGACYECSWLAEHERESALGAETPYRTTRKHFNAVCAPSAALCGSLAAYAAIGLITGVTDAIPGRIHGVNLVAPDTPYLIDDPPRADCPACHGAGIETR
ncbi:ThiF family adenylyltransferase [Amycolatopsis speibonae]|uniref:ThiF family adenylyltransferase n=1 Tax=Amycolatopsis speibonae TaxID=1450224 RepID=A0ABV7PBU4_9PSEU